MRAQRSRTRPRLDLAAELRRDRPFPVGHDPRRSTAWSVYLDNLFQWECWSKSDLAGEGPAVSGFMRAADAAYAHWGTPGNSDEHEDR